MLAGTKKGYKDLSVWQRAIDLVVEIYEITGRLPRSELFGLTSQMRRSAVSIPSNIAEGSKRRTTRDFKHFLSISYGSGAELETQLVILQRLNYGQQIDCRKATLLLDECMRMLRVMIYGRTTAI